MNSDDPTESYIEHRMNMSSEEKGEVRKEIYELDRRFAGHYVEKYMGVPKFEGCPFHAALGKELDAKPNQNVKSIEAVVAAPGAKV